MKKDDLIYIAGHKGLVGSAILRELKNLGFINFALKTREELDLLDVEAVNSFFSTTKPKYVFLCAAKVGGIHANNTYRADFLIQNLNIQNNIINASHKNDVEKLLFLGSSCIYPKLCPQPIKEDYLLTSELEYTNEPYAIAKIAGMRLCENMNLQYGTNYISVMPTNLYGFNDNFNLENSHVMPALIRKTHLAKMLNTGNMQAVLKDLKRDFKNIDEKTALEFCAKHNITANSLEVWGSGNVKREFLHADDMAKACIYIMQNINFKDLIKNQKEIKNTHINIGSGEDLSIKDLAFMIKEIVGFDGELIFNPQKNEGTPRKLLDISKLKNLGFTPSISLKEGIKKVYEDYKN